MCCTLKPIFIVWKVPGVNFYYLLSTIEELTRVFTKVSSKTGYWFQSIVQAVDDLQPSHMQD